MRLGQGRTIAATAGMLLGLAAAVVAAPAATAAPKPTAGRPALAVGRSADGTTWRLEGRRLTVRLRGKAIVERREQVRVRCGEGLFTSPVDAALWTKLFASSWERRVVLRRTSRALTVRLPRDVAASATYCGIEPIESYAEIEPLRWAAMTVRRGARPGCRPAAAEQVIFSDATVQVTHASASEEMTDSDTYRVCTGSKGSLRPLAAMNSGGGGGGYSLGVSAVEHAGGRLAWLVTVGSHGAASPAVMLQRFDLANLGRGAAYVSAPETGGMSVTGRDLRLASNGAAVWADRATRPAENGGVHVTERLLAAPAGAARAEVLATASGERAIADIALSPDGRTVTWRENGVERSAEVT